MATREQVDPKYPKIRIHACWFKIKNSNTRKKYLGLQIDEHLTWQSHIESVAKKVVCSLSMLKKVRKCINPDNLMKIYKSVIEPYFDYCSIVWDALSSELTNKLQPEAPNQSCKNNLWSTIHQTVQTYQFRKASVAYTEAKKIKFCLYGSKTLELAPYIFKGGAVPWVL